MKIGMLITESKHFHLILIFIAVFLVFGNSLSFDFVWDDLDLVLGNDTYRNFDLGGMLLSPGNELEYLPVRDLSYAVDFLFWGSNPMGFHFTNVVLYFLSALFAYLMTVEITSLLFSEGSTKTELPPRAIAFFSTMLFVSHPVHSEPVSFIICRNVLLSGMFFFMTCYLYLKFLRAETGGRGRYYAASLICLVLALFSKATSISLPLVLLLLLLFVSRKKLRPALNLMPFFAVSGAAFYLFKAIADRAGVIHEDQTVAFGALNYVSKIAVAARIPFFYIKKLVLPFGFSAEYSARFSRTFGDPVVILALLALAVILFVGVLLRKKYPEVLFAECWFMVALVPVLNFFVTHPVVADRYAYLPSYAFFFLTTVFTVRLFSLTGLKRAFIFMLAVVAVWSAISVERNAVWASDKTLWEDTMRVSPDSPKAHINLGIAYFSEGQYDKAFDTFEKVDRLNPLDTNLEYHKGRLMYSKGDFQGVIGMLNETLKVKPGSLKIYNLLGQAYEMTGDVEKAIENYMDALNTNDINVALREITRQRLDESRAKISPRLDVLRRTAQENPSDPNARAQLGIALDRAGFFNEAIAAYSELEQSGKDNWGLYYNMANIYKKTGEYKKAAAYYKKSMVLNRKNPDIYNNLGLVYKKLRKYGLAIQAFEGAMEADGSFAYAPFNLAVLYFHLGDRENTLRYFDHVRKSFPKLIKYSSPYLEKMEG